MRGSENIVIPIKYETRKSSSGWEVIFSMGGKSWSVMQASRWALTKTLIRAMFAMWRPGAVR